MAPNPIILPYHLATLCKVKPLTSQPYWTGHYLVSMPSESTGYRSMYIIQVQRRHTTVYIVTNRISQTVTDLVLQTPSVDFGLMGMLHPIFYYLGYNQLDPTSQ